MKEVLIICAHRRGRSPSQRYRFEQYLDYLSTQGFRFKYSNLLTQEDDAVFYSQGNLLKKIWILFRSVLQRMRDLRRLKHIDLVFIQRESHFLGSTFFERGVKKAGIPMIFDFDDSIWLADTSPGNKKWQWLKSPDKIFSSIRLADLVFAGNAYLVEKAAAFNKNIFLLPTTIDTDQHFPQPELRNSDVVVLGWSGSISTIKHFNLLLPVLKRLSAKYGKAIRFRLLADKNYQSDLALESLIWSADTEVQVLNSFDIGLMPLPDDEWSRGKCGLKGLSYMACGVATVMSAVGVNSEIIETGKNGYLAGTEEEWFQLLCDLIDNKEKRLQLGEAGRKTVLARYSVEANKQNYLELFQNAIPTR